MRSSGRGLVVSDRSVGRVTTLQGAGGMVSDRSGGAQAVVGPQDPWDGEPEGKRVTLTDPPA